MAKGNKAKQYIADEICKIFKDKVVKIEGSKIYINALEDGFPCQICLNMTCPKTPVEGGPVQLRTSNSCDCAWETATPIPVAAAPQTEITEQEKQNIADLMARLGL